MSDSSNNKPEGWRGAGIFINQGSFRLRNFSINLTTGASSMVPELRTDTWQHWLAIASDGRALAEAGRVDGVAAGADDAVFGAALEREFRGSLVAIAAAAFALDAFYASTVEHAPEARVNAGSRKAKLLETFKQAYALRGRQQGVARQAIYEVFKLRDQAVHPSASFTEPAPHPVYEYRWNRASSGFGSRTPTSSGASRTIHLVLPALPEARARGTGRVV